VPRRAAVDSGDPEELMRVGPRLQTGQLLPGQALSAPCNAHSDANWKCRQTRVILSAGALVAWAEHGQGTTMTAGGVACSAESIGQGRGPLRSFLAMAAARHRCALMCACARPCARSVAMWCGQVAGAG
jgi:hypothetical protein